MSRKPCGPRKGELWWVNFGPSVGQEIQKLRPAVVVGEDAIGRTGLRIIVPVTDSKSRYASCPWFIHLPPAKTNGLTKDSEADASQVKSVSVKRFNSRMGTATPTQLRCILDGIALCIGY